MNDVIKKNVSNIF